MKAISVLGAAILAISASPCVAQSRNAQPEPDFPQVRASPGVYQSGNSCAPDRAEPAWGANNRFLGYICVRNPTTR